MTGDSIFWQLCCTTVEYKTQSSQTDKFQRGIGECIDSLGMTENLILNLFGRVGVRQRGGGSGDGMDGSTYYRVIVS